MMTKNSFLLFCIAGIIFSSGCGRKNNNIFDFPKKEKRSKFNRLTLPAVQKLTIEKEDDVVTLNWKKIANAQYDVYRFIRTAFIPKHPLNKIPLTKTTYVDTSNPPPNTCYLVRPIFYINGKKVAGPSSKIVCI